MAIQFARIQWVRRGSTHSNKSSGSPSQGTPKGNMCLKSAYITRDKIECKETSFEKEKVYDFRKKEPVKYTEILLPKEANPRFKDNPEALWNAVHKSETRVDSRLGGEMVLALSSDECVTDEDRVQMVLDFANQEFVEKGLGVQIAIHDDDDGNIHAHFLFTIRKFDGKDGELGLKRPQDLFPGKGKGVLFAIDWGKIWAKFQNEFFRKNAIDLKVDPIGVVSQKHKGPVRMRGENSVLKQKWKDREDLAKKMTKDPRSLVSSMVIRDEVFSEKEVRKVATHFLSEEEAISVIKGVFSLSEVVPLYDKSGKKTGWCTTKSVLEDSRSLFRIANKISSKFSTINDPEKFTKGLRDEQKKAFLSIANGSNFSLLEGDAGTGKSYVLRPLSEAFKNSGFVVRGLGPDNATVELLKEDGISNSESIHSLLWNEKLGKRSIQSGKEIWIVDESGKASTDTMLELLKVANHHNVKLVLSGDSKQCPPVGRGRPFDFLCKKFGSSSLIDIQRQNTEEKRRFAKNLASGDVGAALQKMVSNGWIQWSTSLDDSRQALIACWKEENKGLSRSRSLIVAATNREVRLINQNIREIRKEWGEIEKDDVELVTKVGIDSNRTVLASVGDSIEFRKKDKDLGVVNGSRASVIAISSKKVRVRDSKNREFAFDPRKYKSWTLGYASTNYRSQGATVDRCYVLHEPSMNKPNFYVGLTRHRDQVMMFVSREKVRDLATLRYQMLKVDSKPCLSDLRPLSEIEEMKKKKQTEDRVNELRSSDRFVDKTKAEAINIIGKAKEGIGSFFTRYKDKQPSQEFFTIKEENEPDLRQMANVHKKKTSWGEVFSNTELDVLGSYLDACDSIHSDSSESDYKKRNRYAHDLVITIPKEKIEKVLGSSFMNRANHMASGYIHNKTATKSQSSKLNTLSTEKQKVLKAFCEANTSAGQFRAAYEESKLDEWKMKWWDRCRDRNDKAFEASKLVTKQEAIEFLGKRQADFMLEKAEKHRESLSRPEEINKIYCQLSVRMMELATELIGERPTGKSAGTLRFGSKGSLAVKVSGPEAGSWHDFENDEGGGVFNFISRFRGCTFNESLEYARDFLGSPKKELPQTWTSVSDKKKNSWKSVPPPTNFQNPRIKSFDDLKEKVRYAYRDSEGKLLFYVLRFEGKSFDGGKPSKVTLPFTFGSDGNGKQYWRLKGWSGGPVIYGLELLFKDKEKPVLIVEGEKAADAARSKYGDKYVCISWNGGCSNVEKVDWSPLSGRNVVIWPDNDEPGIKAGQVLSQKSVLSGAASVRLVFPKDLSKDLAKGWDLADELPQGVKEKNVTDRLLLSQEVAPKIDSIVPLCSRDGSFLKDKVAIREMIRDLVVLCMERRAKSTGISGEQQRKEIRDEVVRIFNGVSQEKKPLEHSGNKDRLLLESMRYQARTGQEPSAAVLEGLREELKKEKGVGQQIEKLGRIHGRDTALVVANEPLKASSIEKFSAIQKADSAQGIREPFREFSR